ncbi:glycosyltransferase family 4 protein [Prochlorococcus sp. AH-716-B20]|nr:glycosyltransferase family 4 protein [Prochlorococcus sp. AH-716-B20]
MKIIYLHQYFSNRDGSGSSRSYNFANGLVKSGHSVKVICFNGGRENTGLTHNFHNGWRTGFTDGIEIIEFDIPYSNHDSIFVRSSKFLIFSLKALRFTLFDDADLIFASSTPLTVSLPAIAAKWFRGIPYIFEVRDLWPELPVAMGIIKNPILIKILKLLEWLSYRSAIACIGLSPGICEGIIRKGVKANNVTLIPNVCDAKIFKPLRKGNLKNPKLINGLSRRLGPHDFVAVYAGAHSYANGLDSVIDAAIEIQNRGYLNIKILFIGDGKLKNKLIERVKNLLD